MFSKTRSSDLEAEMNAWLATNVVEITRVLQTGNEWVTVTVFYKEVDTKAWHSGTPLVDGFR